MKVLVMAMAVGSAVASGVAPAGEGDKLLQLRPKAAISSAMTQISPAQANTPFVSPTWEGPELVFDPRRSDAREATRSSCEGERSLCYDSASGRVVYKPARQLMPDLPGMRPENISLKRNQIVFRYSFQ